MNIILVNQVAAEENLIILSDREQLDWGKSIFSTVEFQLLQQLASNQASYAILQNNGRWVIVEFLPSKDQVHQQAEALRIQASQRIAQLRQYQLKSLCLSSHCDSFLTQAYLEGLVLSNYQFLNYFSDAEKRRSCLQNIKVLEECMDSEQLEECKKLLEAVYIFRDLVNEPQSFLNAVQLSKEVERLGKEAGFQYETFDKEKIEALGMGGLLAVNRGSLVPPTFNIMEWKPENAQNTQPIVLVGKGVVYDTGGLSLKPTANSMDFMKCDMAGGGLVIALLYAIAKNKLPLHVIGLVPATDNRPGVDAYAPGDVIKMYSGNSVEVLNTDAEGRMILADALHYAKQYNPLFVLDFATLTGAAARAIGGQACVMMGTMGDDFKSKLQDSAQQTYERFVEFPIWEEYADDLKSEIADIKNLGGPAAGAITAGKFLQFFTDYPWMHFDIAGVSWKHSDQAYKLKGGSGFGVRLIYHLLKQYC